MLNQHLCIRGFTISCLYLVNFFFLLIVTMETMTTAENVTAPWYKCVICNSQLTRLCWSVNCSVGYHTSNLPYHSNCGCVFVKNRLSLLRISAHKHCICSLSQRPESNFCMISIRAYYPSS